MLRKFLKITCIILSVCLILTNVSYGHNVSVCKNHNGGTRYYYIDKTVPQNYANAYKRAVKEYSKLSYINLIQTTNADKASLVFTVTGKNLEDADKVRLLHSTITLEDDYDKKSTGGCHVDWNRYCIISMNRYLIEKNKLNLNSIAMHEIGHAFGLEHVNSKKSIMYLHTTSLTTLQSTDKNNLSKMYNPTINRVSYKKTKSTRTTANIKLSGTVSSTHNGSTIKVYNLSNSKLIASSVVNYGKTSFSININNIKRGSKLKVTITSKDNVNGNSKTITVQ